jgi:tetratricopeptide (TPR) repeat protein
MFFFRVFLLAALLSTACSCAQLGSTHQNVELPVWQSPHRQDVRRIALLPFEGDAEFSKAMQAHVLGRLREAGYFEIILLTSPAAGSAVEPADAILHRQLQQARAARVDTLVRGRVRTGYGRSGMGNFSIGLPLHKAVMTLETLDVASGKVRDREQVMKEFKGEVELHPDSGQSEADLFEQLARNCADQLISEVFVGRTTISVPLALGERKTKEIWQGNLLARQGRWSAARKTWEAALVRDPNSHAAQYNLGLASEACQQFGKAHDHYAAAIELADHEAYHTAVVRCRLANQQYLLALQNWQGGGQPLAALTAFRGPPVAWTGPNARGVEKNARLLRRLPAVQ